jgi:hypothetical protein
MTLARRGLKLCLALEWPRRRMVGPRSPGRAHRAARYGADLGSRGLVSVEAGLVSPGCPAWSAAFPRAFPRPGTASAPSFIRPGKSGPGCRFWGGSFVT